MIKLTTNISENELRPMSEVLINDKKYILTSINQDGVRIILDFTFAPFLLDHMKAEKRFLDETLGARITSDE